MHETAAPRFPRLRLMMLVTLITLVVALWYLAAHLVRDGHRVDWATGDAACDLRDSACEATLGEGRRLRLAMATPSGLRALEPLPLTVSLEGIEAKAVHVDFVGRDMDMGLHRFPLEEQGDGRFQGVGQVPICTQAVMPWEARVVVETTAGRLGGKFDFEVERSRP